MISMKEASLGICKSVDYHKMMQGCCAAGSCKGSGTSIHESAWYQDVSWLGLFYSCCIWTRGILRRHYLASRETACATTVERKAKWKIVCSRCKIDHRGAPSPTRHHFGPVPCLSLINNDNTRLSQESWVLYTAAQGAKRRLV